MAHSLPVGSVVRFAKPMTDEDEAGTFLVIEDRDERVLVADLNPFWDDRAIRPTSCYLAAEMVIVEVPNAHDAAFAAAYLSQSK